MMVLWHLHGKGYAICAHMLIKETLSEFLYKMFASEAPLQLLVGFTRDMHVMPSRERNSH